jgi:3-deoxy-D-manno-octulosonate 8-phosphate phosphatase (KDO 8-P phosphatase)
MKSIEPVIRERAYHIRQVWTDVDGVLTPQGTLAIYDVLYSGSHVAFESRDGLCVTRLVPCDEYGRPLSNSIEYFAGYPGAQIMEGYRFDTRDGMVVKYLVEAGVPVYFISGRDSPCVRARASALGAVPLLGARDKLAVMQEHATCSLDEILFIGDGIQDCDALRATGISVAPADAAPEAVLAAQGVTHAVGGSGVLSEVATYFMKARGMWPE